MVKIITVHGTFAADKSDSGDAWWQRDSAFTSALLRRLEISDENYVIEPFHWDGANSELSRRKWGKRLYNRLKSLEEAKEPYHLVGHSHGGAVIMEALRESNRKGIRLEALQSIVTVGTPFLEFVSPLLGRILRLMTSIIYGALLFLPIVVGILFLAFQMSERPGDLSLQTLSDFLNFSLRTSQLDVYFLCVEIFVMTSAIVIAARRLPGVFRIVWRHQRAGGSTSLFDWYADKWVGLHDREDEAVNVLSASRRSPTKLVPRDLVAGPLGYSLALITFVPALLFFMFFAVDTLRYREVFENLDYTIQGMIPVGSIIAVLVGAIGYLIFHRAILPGFRFISSWTVSWPFAAVADRFVWSIVNARAFGRDIGSIKLRRVRTFPHEFKSGWRPLPDSYHEEIKGHVSQYSNEIMARVRGLLGRFHESGGGFSLTESIGEELTGRELIHTAYFDIPRTTDYVAYQILIGDGALEIDSPVREEWIRYSQSNITDMRPVRPEAGAEKSDRRSQILLAAFVVLVGLGGVANWQLLEPETPISDPTSELRIGSWLRDCEDCPDLVVVPRELALQKGQIPPATKADPRDPIAVGIFEVSIEQWMSCIKAGSCSAARYERGWFRTFANKLLPASWIETCVRTGGCGVVRGMEPQLSKPGVVPDSVHRKSINSVAISRDGRFVVTGSDDKTARIWDLQTGLTVQTFGDKGQGHAKRIQSVAISTDGRFVITGSSDKTARVWEVQTGQTVQTFGGEGLGHVDAINSVAISRDSRYVVTGSDDRTARMWDVQTGETVQIFGGDSQGHERWVTSVAISRDGRFVVTGSGDKTARLWDVQTGQTVKVFGGDGHGHVSAISSVAISTDGRFVITGSHDGTARMWGVQTDQTVKIFSGDGHGHVSAISSIAISTDGRFVITGSHDGTARMWDVQTGRTVQTFKGDGLDYEGRVRSVAISTDGRFVLTGSDDKPDTTALLWDVQTGQRVQAFGSVGQGYASEISSVAISRDGRFVVTGSSDRTARMWDVQTGQTVQTFRGDDLRYEDYIESVAISTNGRFVVTATGDNARMWDAQTGQTVQTFDGNGRGHQWPINSVAISTDGRFVLTGSTRSIRIWDVQSGQTVQTIRPHIVSDKDWILSFAISTDGRFVVTGSADRTARVWDVQTGQTVQTFGGNGEGHEKRIRSVAISRDGRFVVTGSDDKTARVWDVQAGQTVQTFGGNGEGHEERIRSVAISTDGRYVVTGSDDKTARVWDVQTGQTVQTLGDNDHGHESGIPSVAISADGRFVVTGSFDNARIWDVQTGETVHTLGGDGHGHGDWNQSVAISIDGGVIFTGSSDNTARMWDTQTGQTVQTFGTDGRGHTRAISSIAVSTDGRFVVTGSYDETALMWDVKTGQTVQTFGGDGHGHEDWIRSVAISKDGRFVVTGSADKTARVWDIKTGQTVQTLGGDSLDNMSGIRSVAISRDGRFVVTGSDDQTAQLWNVTTGKRLGAFSVGSEVFSIAFGGNSNYIATHSTDGMLRLWHFTSFRLMTEIPIPGKTYISSITFDERDVRMSDRKFQYRTWQNALPLPVAFVSYQDALDYTGWLTQNVEDRKYRLLKEDEWRNLADKGERETSSSKANDLLDENEMSVKLAPIGTTPPNHFGLHDMNGSLSEWVEKKVADDEATMGIALGASWWMRANDQQGHTKLSYEETTRRPVVGFRVARDLTPEELSQLSHSE